MAPRIIRSAASRGAHIRALHGALVELKELVPADPHWRRVAIANHISALKRAYPEELSVNEVDLMQHLAEEDGDEVEA